MANLDKIAAVFDAMADYVDQNEREKASSVLATRNARLDKIASLHVSTHGEELPDLVRQKLAKTDDASLDVVEDLLTKQAGAVPVLGHGADPDGEPPPATTKQAADAAGERLVSWLMS